MHLFRASLLALLAVSCSAKKDVAPADAAPAVVVVDAATAPDAGAPTSSQRASALRALNEGRQLSRQKRWPEALAAFDRALAVAPDDARVLSEVGWAAFQANDLARAEKANAQALAHSKEPLVRAPILYNVGRVAEARGNAAAARKAYADSLALRDNAEVKARLATVGGPPDDDFRVGVPRACAGGFATIPAFCKCLLDQKEDGLFPEDVKRTCSKEPVALDDVRLSAVTWGPEMLGERLHLLLVREGTQHRVVAELGRDYEPGAFGVHNEAQVKKGEKREVNGHTVVVVSSNQNDNDSNAAGLELCFAHAKLETVCALSDTPGATKCTPAIPVAIDAGCGPGAEPDAKDLDEDLKKTVADIKKNATRTSVTTSWTLSNEGVASVKLLTGSRDRIEPKVLLPHALWK